MTRYSVLEVCASNSEPLLSGGEGTEADIAAELCLQSCSKQGQ